MKNTIEFDRPFAKLLIKSTWREDNILSFHKMGILIHAQQVFRSMIHPSFFDYDCAAGCAVHDYEFKDRLLLLIFRVAPNQIITTLRTDNEENRDKYFGGLGQTFKFDIQNLEYAKVREGEFLFDRERELTGEWNEEWNKPLDDHTEKVWSKPFEDIE